MLSTSFMLVSRHQTPAASTSHLTTPLSLQHQLVRKTLQKINPCRAAGADGVPGRVLRDCAQQLSSVMADIFNISLSQATVPTCLKTSTIVPVPKASAVSCLNDYRPAALTPIVPKCFERLVMARIKKSINITTDSRMLTDQTALQLMPSLPSYTRVYCCCS